MKRELVFSCTTKGNTKVAKSNRKFNKRVRCKLCSSNKVLNAINKVFKS